MAHYCTCLNTYNHSKVRYIIHYLKHQEKLRIHLKRKKSSFPVDKKISNLCLVLKILVNWFEYKKAKSKCKKEWWQRQLPRVGTHAIVADASKKKIKRNIEIAIWKLKAQRRTRSAFPTWTMRKSVMSETNFGGSVLCLCFCCFYW